jgi:hypothetical protein
MIFGVFVDVDPCPDCSRPELTRQPCRMDVRPFREKDAAPEDRRVGARPQCRGRERNGRVGGAEPLRLIHVFVDLAILCGCCRNTEVPVFPPPDISSAFRRKGPDGALGAGAGTSDSQRRIVPNGFHHAWQCAPVTVDLASVHAARACPTDRGFDEDDRETRLPVLESQRSPETRETTADDDHVALLFADEDRRLRGIALVLQGLVEPPGRS